MRLPLLTGVLLPFLIDDVSVFISSISCLGSMPLLISVQASGNRYIGHALSTVETRTALTLDTYRRYSLVLNTYHLPVSFMLSLYLCLLLMTFN